MSRTRLLGRIVLAGVIVASACKKSDSTGPDNQGGGGTLTLSLSSSTLSLVGGGTAGTVTANITRGGNFDGSVTISVTGLPANVTSSAAPAVIPVGTRASTITFTAAAAAAATAGATVTVHATGSGVTEQTATFTLTITASAQGSYTIALTPTSLNFQQGNQGTSTANITRTGGFTGSIAFTATGAPVGMTVTFNPTSTTASSVGITVAATSAVAANTYTLTVHATSGTIDRTATLSVQVTAASTGGGNTVFKWCGTIPVFAAVQDGNGPFTVATITNGTITFTLASGRGAIVSVTATATNYTTSYMYGTQAELNTGAVTCQTTSTGTKTVNGSVANVALTDVAYISVGGAIAFVLPVTGNTFSVQNVPDGTIDAVASRVTQTQVGNSFTQVMNKGIIRRGLNPATGSTLPVFDFNAAESFTPVTKTLTLGALGTDQAIVLESFLTANGSTGILFNELAGSSAATHQFPTVPNTITGDLHLVTAIASTGVAPTTTRTVGAYMKDGADKTLNFGAAMGAVTISSAAATPTARLRVQHTIESDYNKYQSVALGQSSGGISRAVSISVSAAYLNGSTAFDITMADLSGLSGFQAAWGLVAGASTTWSYTGSSWTGGGTLGPTFLDGIVLTMASRSGTITP